MIVQMEDGIYSFEHVAFKLFKIHACTSLYIATVILATSSGDPRALSTLARARKNCILSRATNTGGSRGENGLTRQHDCLLCIMRETLDST